MLFPLDHTAQSLAGVPAGRCQLAGKGELVCMLFLGRDFQRNLSEMPGEVGQGGDSSVSSLAGLPGPKWTGSRGDWPLFSACVLCIGAEVHAFQARASRGGGRNRIIFFSSSEARLSSSSSRDPPPTAAPMPKQVLTWAVEA